MRAPGFTNQLYNPNISGDYMKSVEQSRPKKVEKNVLSSQSGKQTSTCTRISGPKHGSTAAGD